MELNKFLESNTIVIVTLTMIVFLYVNNNKQINYNTDHNLKLEYDKKYEDLLNEINQKTGILRSILEKQKNLENKIDTIDNNNNINNINNNNNNNNNNINNNNSQIDPVLDRDRRVISDPLYPIINRTDRPTFDYLIRNPSIRGIMTRYDDNLDTHRPIAIAKLNTGGVISKSDLYYLFGKRKSKNSSKGDYYLWAPNINNQIKIPLVDDRNNPLIKDFDNIPSLLKIKDGIFAGATVEIQELNNADLISQYL